MEEDLIVMATHDSVRDRMEAWEQQMTADEHEKAMRHSKLRGLTPPPS